MVYKKKENNHPFFKELAATLRNRLEELGMTKYALCRDNNFNRGTCDRILRAQYAPNFNTLMEYLDAVGLEIKIVKKDENHA